MSIADTEDIRMLQADGTWDMSPGDDDVITGEQAVVEQVARRYATMQGTLSYDPNCGTDLLSFLNDNIELPALRVALEAEARKDPRVESAEVTGESTDTLQGSIELDDGTVFDLDLATEET